MYPGPIRYQGVCGIGGVACFVLGPDQERPLRQAATAVVQRTAAELQSADDKQAEHLALMISQVFSEPLPSVPVRRAGDAPEGTSDRDHRRLLTAVRRRSCQALPRPAQSAADADGGRLRAGFSLLQIAAYQWL
jgi:hypothetical protein